MGATEPTAALSEATALGRQRSVFPDAHLPSLNTQHLTFGVDRAPTLPGPDVPRCKVVGARLRTGVQVLVLVPQGGPGAF